jgi:hypothetical protein
LIYINYGVLVTQKLSFGKIILMWEGEWQVSYLIKFYREIKILSACKNIRYSPVACSVPYFSWYPLPTRHCKPSGADLY